MFLLLILISMLLLLVAFVVLAVSIGGSIAIVLFGDVIVCILIIVWLIKKLIFKRK